MWVSVTSSGEVNSIIKEEDLQIEVYTEQLVAMFNAIVSRDAQSPHGKFYYVAKRLQERFAHIKEGAAKDQHQDSDYEPSRNANKAPSTSARQSANQTPLHLLSEVAMGSSNNAASQQQQQQQTQAHTRSQQQAQAALQAHAQHSQQAMQSNWYPNMPTQPTPDIMGLSAQPHFDINFDFTQFDLGTGSDADLSALFIPDSMAMWNFAPDPHMQGYNGF